MSLVIINIVYKGEREPRDRYFKEDILKQCSSKLKRDLEGIPSPKDRSPKRLEVYGSFGPMGTLLDQIEARGYRGDFKVHYMNMPFERVAMLWQAVEKLDIVPMQVNLRQHIRWIIARNKLTAQEVITFHRVFYYSRDVAYPDEKKTPWEILVHQTAWNVDQGRLTQVEQDAIEHQLKTQHPELAAAIEAKVHELKQRRANYTEAKEKAQAKKKREEDKKKKQEDARKASEYRKEQAKRRLEEMAGDVRPISEGAAKTVMTRPPAVWVAVIKKGKHGKPGAPGSRIKKAKEDGAEKEGYEE